MGNREPAGRSVSRKPCRYGGVRKPLATGAPAFSTKGPCVTALMGSASTDAAGGPAGGAAGAGATCSA